VISSASSLIRSSAASFLARAWTLISAVSLRVKILGMVLALVLVLGGSITLQVRATLSRTLLMQLQEESVSLGRDLAARSTDPLLINDLYGILQLLRETQLNNPDVRYRWPAVTPTRKSPTGSA